MTHAIKNSLITGLLIAILIAPQALQAQAEVQQLAGKALLKSLIIPGWGERSLGFNERSNIMLTSEATLWLGYGLLKVLSTRTDDQMVNYAVTNAQVDPAGKSNSYFDDVGNYVSLASYNDQMLRDRRPYLLYPADQGYDWQWESESNRKTFKDIKFRRNLYAHFAVYSLGAVTLNHVISAIDVLWLHNTKLNMQAAPIMSGQTQGIALSLNF